MNPGVSAYGDFKLLVERVIPLDRDYIHVLIGGVVLACVIGWRLARRRPVPLSYAVGLALVVAILNEVLDLWHGMSRSMDLKPAESLKDIGLTLVVPLAAWMALPALRKARRTSVDD